MYKQRKDVNLPSRTSINDKCILRPVSSGMLQASLGSNQWLRFHGRKNIESTCVSCRVYKQDLLHFKFSGGERGLTKMNKLLNQDSLYKWSHCCCQCLPPDGDWSTVYYCKDRIQNVGIMNFWRNKKFNSYFVLTPWIFSSLPIRGRSFVDAALLPNIKGGWAVWWLRKH